MRFYHIITVNLKKLAAAAICAAVCFAAVFTVSAAVSQEQVEIPIVMYHSLLKDEKRQGSYVISPQTFEQDLIWLEEHGYTTILIEDLIAYTRGGSLPEKPVLLTFDDGYYNNYLYAFPIAEAHRAKFVISPIGYYSDAYTETGETNAYYSHCHWAQLQEMAASGLVEVQNHSYNLHKSENGVLGLQQCSGESDAQYCQRLQKDLSLAQERITTLVGKTPTTLVYPFGAISKATPQLAKDLGFACTLTCSEKISTVTRNRDTLYGLGRYLRPAGVSSAEFFTERMKLS